MFKGCAEFAITLLYIMAVSIVVITMFSICSGMIAVWAAVLGKL